MLVVRIRGIIEALVVCVGSKGIRYYQITAIDEYSRKEFRSEEELIENVKRHERLYNNTAKTVLNFKSPNEVVRE
ncbi:hypothetical protein [Streptobacillus moniliformis]|uniref:hypothetical protein n=1 Tax=Streptobacillus moniliformis TaxID=34105 RepID=UPI0007E4A44C|nr:hypothetical protein [Streptobacillus moniliformis]